MIENVWRASFEDDPSIATRPDYNWNIVPSDLHVENAHFESFFYRINGKMYTHDSLEFRNAFNKERTWENLTKSTAK